jgi:hypothetical protein
MPENSEPTHTATIAPTVYWPWPPILNKPARNANATASPVSSSGVAISSVCWSSKAAVDRVLPETHGNSQLRPVPLKIAL